ncbi:hypothetical protein [Dyella japonica]|uniref:Translation initiation factor 2 gamma subunit (eIF-2gamma) n=1 Tax=Dyella japonica TaxID=231455 RepID=A0ABV2JZP4_9GAMM
MSFLSITDLSESQIEAMRSDLLKRQRLFLADFDLSQLPATSPDPLPGGVTPGAAVAGASYMDQHA